MMMDYMRSFFYPKPKVLVWEPESTLLGHELFLFMFPALSYGFKYLILRLQVYNPLPHKKRYFVVGLLPYLKS